MGRENRTDGLRLQPELIDLLREVMRIVAVEDIDTHKMATVVSYNPATQRAVVTVDSLSVIKDLTKDGTVADPNPTLTQTPRTLADVPVAWPRTSSGYLTFPISTGDKGELHVQDRSLDAYLPTGQAAVPATRGTHDLAGAVFHPTIFHNADPITPAGDPAATVLEGETIKIGALAVLAAARTTDAVTATGNMLTWIGLVSTALSITPPTSFGTITGGSAKVEIE